MSNYAKKERAKYWPVSPELMAQYRDGTHTKNTRGTLYWENKNGQWHRDGDLPALIGRDGELRWYQNGKLHRDGDRPAWISADGTLALEWYQNGEVHRDGDKPARIDADGSLEWYQNDQLHRICGPAIICSSGKLEWVIYDENITHEVNDWLAGEEWQGTPEQIVEFKLRFQRRFT